MRAIHALKSDTENFMSVQSGVKRFEIRKDDRGYKVGDELQLYETEYTGEEMANGANLIYTGYWLSLRVTHILRGPVHGLADGWVIMSVERVQT